MKQALMITIKSSAWYQRLRFLSYTFNKEDKVQQEILSTKVH
uniref:Uncharacterized protein n=1 Tax=Arundo donax TaxID=35708 RepID=A0A0A9BZK0_ARUDO